MHARHEERGKQKDRASKTSEAPPANSLFQLIGQSWVDELLAGLEGMGLSWTNRDPRFCNKELDNGLAIGKLAVSATKQIPSTWSG